MRCLKSESVMRDRGDRSQVLLNLRERRYGRPMSLAESITPRAPLGLVRNDWTRGEIRALFALPFPELMFEAARIHRMHFDPSEVQISTLLSIKTGGCP